MQNLVLFGLLVVLLVVAQFAATKTPGDVIRRYINAIGGTERLSELQTLYMEGQGQVNGELLFIRIYREEGRVSRTMITRPNDNIQSIGEQEEGGLQQSESLAMDTADFSTETDLAGPLHGYLEKGYEAELLGKEPVAGNPCYKIKLTKDGDALLWWIDTGSYLLSQSTILPTGLPLDSSEKYYTTYKNYKAVNGMLFAHRVEIQLLNAPVATQVAVVDFTNIQVNPGSFPTPHQSE